MQLSMQQEHSILLPAGGSQPQEESAAPVADLLTHRSAPTTPHHTWVILV